MKEPTDYVIATNWEKVEDDDFFLSEQWGKEHPEAVAQAKEMQKDGGLYMGYRVAAIHLLIYKQMDSQQVFIDQDGDEILSCGGEVIDDTFEDYFVSSQ